MTRRSLGSTILSFAVMAAAVAGSWSSAALSAQTAPAAAAAAATQPETARDPLGRETPRGTVRGFLNAARKGDDEAGRQYLNTRSTTSAATLSHQLFVVLDARLNAPLLQLSDEPDGSGANPATPDQEVVGTIASSEGAVDIVLERVTGRAAGPIWLFSRATLAAVPALHDDVTLGLGDSRLVRLLSGRRFAGIRMFEWAAVLLGLPFFYLLTVLLNKILSPIIRMVWRRFVRHSTIFDREVLPAPVRLLILAFAIRWSLVSLPAPLLARQLWSTLATLATITGIVWLLIALNGEIQRCVHRRFPRTNLAAATTLVRLLRRFADALVVFGGLLVAARRFGFNPAPALAGLGVGGIAVALAAQKTLENVIAGASLIVDQAVRLGDFLKVGDIQGTVDHIGLRSTRIRTLDRTIVSVPNSQIASVSLETFSARDKFWFHPVVGLRYETTAAQLHQVVDGLRRLLDDHPAVDRESVRVRFVGLGEFSLNIEVFAYLHANDWNEFLEMQEQLLFGVTELVENAGTQIAFRARTVYVANAAALPPLSPAQPPS